MTNLITALIGWFKLMRKKRKMRTEIMMMSDKDLKDIGINRFEALYNIRIPPSI